MLQDGYNTYITDPANNNSVQVNNIYVTTLYI